MTFFDISLIFDFFDENYLLFFFQNNCNVKCSTV